MLPEIPGETAGAFVDGLSDSDAVETIKRYMRVRENRGERHAVAYLCRLVSTKNPHELSPQ